MLTEWINLITQIHYLLLYNLVGSNLKHLPQFEAYPIGAGGTICLHFFRLLFLHDEVVWRSKIYWLFLSHYKFSENQKKSSHIQKPCTIRVKKVSICRMCICTCGVTMHVFNSVFSFSNWILLNIDWPKKDNPYYYPILDWTAIEKWENALWANEALWTFNNFRAFAYNNVQSSEKADWWSAEEWMIVLLMFKLDF